jgi:uncharacterized Zn-binding protein involved in type VI secretion
MGSRQRCSQHHAGPVDHDSLPLAEGRTPDRRERPISHRESGQCTFLRNIKAEPIAGRKVAFEISSWQLLQINKNPMFSILGSICVGDKTSCGGAVISGSPFSTVNGRAIARMGDKIACMKNCIIVTGNPTEIIDGAAMALHGAQTSGGCTCLSRHNEFHGDAHGPDSAALVPAAADAGIAFMPDTADLLNEDHWIEFQLTDGQDTPIPRQTYVVIDPSGAEFAGTLDEQGFARVEPVKAGRCTINFPELGHTMAVDSCPR